MNGNSNGLNSMKSFFKKDSTVEPKPAVGSASANNRTGLSAKMSSLMIGGSNSKNTTSKSDSMSTGFQQEIPAFGESVAQEGDGNGQAWGAPVMDYNPFRS